MASTPVAQHETDLEAAIVAAARDLIADGGLPALSMRAVADRVGVSATALYHYFDGKQALVERVVHRAFARFVEHMQGAMEACPVGSMERVRALGDAYIQFALEHQAYFRIIFSIQISHPRELDDLPGGGGYPLLRRAVEDAIASGAMRPGDPDLISLFLWSNVHGLVTLALACRFQEHCHDEPAPSPQELFRHFTPFILEGLRHPAAPGGLPETHEDSDREA